MANYKYPYIPKEYYAAVMYACKLVRETGERNNAVARAARYYGVDEDEVKKHFDARIAAGQKGKKSPNKGKQYKYFIVVTIQGCEAQGLDVGEVEICKGLTANTVENRFVNSDYYFCIRNDCGGAYSPDRFHKVIAEFATKAEAEKAVANMSREELHKLSFGVVPQN